MTTEERLTRIEAHLFGMAEQPKPPLGVKPKWLIQENRRDELSMAIKRYEEAGQQVPQEWIDEHRELENALELRHNEKANQPKFESFYVDCTRDEYPEVKRILKAQGYELDGVAWAYEEDCVSATENGLFYTYKKICRNDFKPTITLPQLREKFGVEQPQEQLRDFVVPLEHATLTREEVAARCIAAAEKKGYRADKDREYSDFRIYANKNCRQPRYFMTNSERDGYGFRFQDTLKNHDEYTLEAFEEYCGVEQPTEQPPKLKTRIEWLNELPDGYRERAVSNCLDECKQEERNSIHLALLGICDWRKTPEGFDFWDAVYLHYTKGQPIPPLPTGNSENPNTHEPTEQPVYEAGFWFGGEQQHLCLHDGTKIWYSNRRQAWIKDGNLSENRDPHTLTPVKTHTVGRFYALAGIEQNHLNDWRSYALCVKNEGVPHFVRPTSEYGIVSVDRIRPSHVSLNEVTPL